MFRIATLCAAKGEDDMEEILVANVDDIPDRGCTLAEHGAHEFGIFRIGDEVFAWHNSCAHQGGPVCQGRLFPKVVETLGENQVTRGLRYAEDELHIVCPWHGYEYNVRTGKNSGRPGLELKPVDVVVRDRGVYVRL